LILPESLPAHGRVDQAQEKPREWPEQEEEWLLLSPGSEEEEHEKADMSLHVSFPPHDGQGMLFPLSLEKTSCSKVFPHSLHLNSYMGISFSAPLFLERLHTEAYGRL
jgi:hypothetical protein